MLSAAVLVLLASGPQDTINAEIGDLSWVAVVGRTPAGVSETSRIAVHLDFVERLLRSRDVTHLGSNQRVRRARALDQLATYRRRGVVPRRTDDGFAGRRPRFIDDRGVHCAVGYLIAASGRTELAQAIDERFEYAYVREMAEPELLAWAFDHGFTVDELAMIQPSYRGAPTSEGTRRAVLDSADAFTLACAREHRPLPAVQLHVRGQDSGRASASTENTDSFAQCFAKLADKLERGDGAYDETIETYQFDAHVRIRDPQRILTERLARMRFDRACAPRPGPFVTKMTYDVRVGKAGVTAKVVTTPKNAEVAQCLEGRLTKGLRDFGAGIWRLSGHGERFLNRSVTSERLRGSLTNYAPRRATECVNGEAPGKVSVNAVAVTDADAFKVTVKGGDEVFRNCVGEKVQADLRHDQLVSRLRPDGTYEKYFRIDADTTASVSFDVETPAALDKRIEEARRRAEEQRYDF